MDEAKERILSLSRAFAYGRDERMPCPFCSSSRQNKNDRCLSVVRYGDRVTYNCWHCSEHGAISTTERKSSAPPARMRPHLSIVEDEKPKKIERDAFSDLSAEDVAYLASRGISRETALRIGIKSHSFGIGFPYGKGVEGYKVRSISSKKFIVVGKIGSLMNLERVEGDTLVITEGEIDAASLVEAGISSATSIPHGADPGLANRSPDDNPSARLSFLLHDADRLKSFRKIVLFLDDDQPGKITQDELARRLGRARCWTVKYPEGCKDANDILMRHGKDALRKIVEAADPIAIPGLGMPRNFLPDLKRLWRGEKGKGISTGIKSLDRYFTVAPGNWTAVTGHPGSGKSELIDQISVNIAESHGWKTAFRSMENMPDEHVAKLIEKRARRRFHDSMQNRMHEAEMEAAFKWVDEHFVLMTDDAPATMKATLELASDAVLRHGISNLVIDPFNYMTMPGEKREDIEISDMLTMISGWVKSHDSHCFFIGHPKKTPSDVIPKGNDMAGAAAWFAKTDFGLTVHRGEFYVDVNIWKVRRSHLGHIGATEIGYSTKTATYYDLEERSIGSQPKPTDDIDGLEQIVRGWEH